MPRSRTESLDPTLLETAARAAKRREAERRKHLLSDRAPPSRVASLSCVCLRCPGNFERAESIHRPLGDQPSSYPRKLNTGQNRFVTRTTENFLDPSLILLGVRGRADCFEADPPSDSLRSGHDSTPRNRPASRTSARGPRPAPALVRGSLRAGPWRNAAIRIHMARFVCAAQNGAGVRIISGHLRGRDLGAVPDGVRPTSDRVRESLFSALGSVDGDRVLDLFAGSGALGLEAYSRGASAVVFVERSRKVAQAIRKRIQRLGLEEIDQIELVQADATTAIRRLESSEAQPFDLVFLDPPYAEGDREGTLEALFASSLLAEDATVVVEGPTRHPVPPVAGARLLDERRYGDTLLTWLTPVVQGERVRKGRGKRYGG